MTLCHLPRIPASEPLDTIVDALLEHGCVVVEKLLTAATVARFNSEISPYIDGPNYEKRTFINETVDAFFGKNVRHVVGVAQKSDIFVNDILCHPIYLALGERLLKTSCEAFQLNLAQVLERGPAEPAQFVHRDHDLWPDLGHGIPHRQISSVIALGEFTAEMGATLIVPGSHRWERGRQPRPEEIVPAAMEPGSAVIYLGGTLHAGGANTTADRRRRGMHLSYCLGWLRTEENNYLSISLERARKLSPLAQTLLGYAAHDGISRGYGYLGAVDLRNPMELFAEGKL
jgi:ectoine hydroxylase-related dioxygenase (phytanoyl-CoA dioxygenase family)